METAIEHWRLDLADLTLGDLLAGIEGSRNLKFLPSLGEFRAQCLRGPDYESLLVEAQVQMSRRRDGRDAWTNPLAFWAASEFSYGDLQALSVGALWRSAVDGNKHRMMDPVPPRVMDAPKIEQEKRRAINDAEREQLQAIMTKVERQDGLAWARAIMEKVKRKEPVPQISETYAREALTARLGAAAFEQFMALDTQH